MAKQLIKIINDCRRCPNFNFRERYPGGVIFLCKEMPDYKDLLIPYQNTNKIGFIHKECPLENKIENKTS